MKAEDNVFPPHHRHWTNYQKDESITYRDYIAIECLKAIISNPADSTGGMDGVKDACADAYTFADAMIKESNK